MKLTFDDKGGFYVDEDKVDEDGLHPEVLLPDDVNKEIERLRGLLFGFKCIYCNKVVGKEYDNYADAQAVLAAHIESCFEHPLAKAQIEIDRLTLVTEGQLAQIERLRTRNECLAKNKEQLSTTGVRCADLENKNRKLRRVVDAARRCPIRREHEELYQALRELEE